MEMHLVARRQRGKRTRPLVEIFRTALEGATSPLPQHGDIAGFPIYRLTLERGGDGVQLHWVRNRTVMRDNGDLVSAGATLAEWHHFTETMTRLVNEVTSKAVQAAHESESSTSGSESPPGKKRQSRSSRMKKGALDDCTVA